MWKCRITHVEVHCALIKCRGWEVESAKLLTVLRGRKESRCCINKQCRHSRSEMGFRSPGVFQFSLCATIQDIRRGFTLCIRSPLVGVDTLQTPVTGALHDKLLIYPRLVQSAGCSGSQGVICFVAFDACQLAKTSNSLPQSCVPQWTLRIPTCRCWISRRLHVEGMRWCIFGTQLTVSLK